MRGHPSAASKCADNPLRPSGKFVLHLIVIIRAHFAAAESSNDYPRKLTPTYDSDALIVLNTAESPGRAQTSWCRAQPYLFSEPLRVRERMKKKGPPTTYTVSTTP